MVGFSEVVYPVSESVGNISICIDMVGVSERNVVVNLSRVDTESEDFLLETNETRLEFQSGQAQVCVSVMITNDVTVERQETYMLEVTTSDPDVEIFRATATLNIADDDSKTIIGPVVEDVH